MQGLPTGVEYAASYRLEDGSLTMIHTISLILVF